MVYPFPPSSPTCGECHGPPSSAMQPVEATLQHDGLTASSRPGKIIQLLLGDLGTVQSLKGPESLKEKSFVIAVSANR